MERNNTHVLYGAISGIAMVVIILAIYLTGSSEVTGMRFLPNLPLVLGVALNGIAYSKANGGDVTFKNVFASCFKAAMLICLMVILYTIVSAYVFPEIKIKMIEAMRAQPPEKQGMTEEQKQKSIALMTKYFVTIMVSYTILPLLIWGAVSSLIGAGIAKKNG